MVLLGDDLLTEAEQDGAPVNLRLVASFRGIVAIETATWLTGSALVMPAPDGVRVLLNAEGPGSHLAGPALQSRCGEVWEAQHGGPFRRKNTGGPRPPRS